ncbi:unnamed protein product [Rodentolepis nana]|uniref:Multidrug and toxin extrusion protein n=1 Tax=Rodentolepis nana TaxID=102285 RepID=A0A158QIK0_RODNA|nr:unnamed protein product [Rodentolepis nana]
MASHCLISIAVFQFVGGVVGVCSGIIRGVGMQRVGAIVCIVCMYLVGGPLGLCLLMLTDLGVSGFWWGLSVGMGAEAVVYIILILRIDWHKMCEKAAQRTEIKFVNGASREIEIEFEPKTDGGEEISEEIETDFEEVKACTTKLLLTRGTFVTFCFSTIVVALLCRFFLDWRRHFPSYCHHVNGSLIPIDFTNGTQIMGSAKPSSGVDTLMYITDCRSHRACSVYSQQRYITGYSCLTRNFLNQNMEYKSTESINSVYELQDDLPPKNKGRWGYYLPYGFWYEFKHLQMLAIPLMLTGMSHYAIVPISIAFLGQLGKSELAAGGLAISIFHVAGLSIIAGLLTASETLFSQTIGGENKFRLGIQVQKAGVILAFCCMPCCAIYIISEPILLLTGQPPLVARGSALSQSFGFLAQAIFLIGYIYISRLYRKTWDAIHVELWHDWGVWFRLAIPGMVMSGLEWWVCESGSIVSGLRGENALAVQTILNNIESLLYCMFPLGLLLSTTIRIGQFLGANNADGPRATSIVGLTTILVNSVIISITLIFTRSYIPRLFSSDPAIIDSAADGLIAIAVFLFVDSIVAVCAGIIRGVGMQKAGGIVCIVCMYLIGGPLGISLLLLTDLGVAGFWYGLSAGTGSEAIIYIIIILRIDWNKMCKKAQKRTEIKFINKSASQQQVEDKEAAEESEASDLEKVDSDSEVKACTQRIVFTRSILITLCFMSIIAALVIRFQFDWKSYFQTYCLHMNGDLIAVPTANATDFDFSKCQQILP